MILKELLDTTWMIGELDVNVRNDRGILLDWIRIGSYVETDRIEKENPRWKVINKPLCFKEKGRDDCGVILGSVPKKLLAMKVTAWDMDEAPAFRMNNGLWRFRTLRVHVVGEDDCVITIEEPKKEIEGQMKWIGTEGEVEE